MYYLSPTKYAQPLLDLHPKAARYNNGKYVLIGDYPDFDGEISRLDELGLNAKGRKDEHGKKERGLSGVEIKFLFDVMRGENPKNKLVVMSGAQGRHLHRTHPDFMPKDEDV